MKNLSLSVLAVFIAQLAFSQALTPLDVELQSFYTGSAVPVGIYSCGDNRLFILEKDQSDIEIITTSGTYVGKFLDLTGFTSTGGERGLLGMAFHPDYATNGYFYVNYTNTSGNTVVRRFTVSTDANVADDASGYTIITITQTFSNHNGGHIAFGPDGYLYIGMGDGGSAGDPNNASQTPTQLLGKMLRIDVDGGSPYAIPADNPYFGQADTLPEIWALGLRNPWKFSFDRLTGDMWIGDVGQGTWEEIDFQPNGTAALNYGWRCYEGNANYNTAGCQSSSFYDFPVADYSHGGDGFCSITGGVVYRGEAFPAMQGTYFFSDYCNSTIFTILHSGNSFIEDELSASTNGIVAFGEDLNGEVYVVSNSGPIYKLVDSCPFYPALTGNTNGELETDAGTQYWWYQNGTIIPGANSQTYTPTQAGTYYARVSNGECTRQTNSVQWVVVSGIPGCTYGNALNFDPAAMVDDGTCQFSVDCTCPADLDVNGEIGVSDLILFIGLYGDACGE
ncbi:MAG: PQQ-dependent sugar dehydrogenase [Flavobacteriales bacterium]